MVNLIVRAPLLGHNSANLLNEEMGLDNFYGPLSFMFPLRKQLTNYINQENRLEA